jgi:hypothetical protein
VRGGVWLRLLIGPAVSRAEAKSLVRWIANENPFVAIAGGSWARLPCSLFDHAEPSGLSPGRRHLAFYTMPSRGDLVYLPRRDKGVVTKTLWPRGVLVLVTSQFPT